MSIEHILMESSARNRPSDVSFAKKERQKTRQKLRKEERRGEGRFAERKKKVYDIH